ncbi:MAG TPA: PAS domain S-box protein [Anaerolineales bacterium]|nr:PAS domain S-box protein [Anaerolineales bacterium]
MNFIDMRTIVLSYVISNAACLIVMALLWLRNRNRFSGLGFWLADFAMQFVVICLVALRHSLPQVLSIVVSNALVIAGTILLLIGLEHFVGKRTSQVYNYVLLGIFIFVHSYFTFIQPSLLIRTINLSMGIILVASQCAWLLIYRADADMRPITRSVGYIFLAFCLASLARILIDLVVNPGNDFFRSGTFEALATLTNQMLFIALTFGLLLMVNRRLVAVLEGDIAKRTQAEENLRRFELLVEHSRDIILFIRREDGCILDANSASVQTYGYGHAELLALTVRDLRASNTHELTSEQMAQADAGGVLFETTHRRKDGSTFPVEVSSQGATIGGVRTLISIVRDITERKRAEAEIESLSLFPTENPYPVLRVQNDGQVAYANAASRELLETWGCAVDGYLPAEWQDLIRTTVDNASVKTLDVSCNDKTYSITLVPIVESGYVNIYGSDITARKRAEQALYESEEKYRLISDNANDWIYWIEPDRSFRYVSPSCERITGYTSLEFMDNPGLFIDIIHPEDRDRIETHLGEVREGDETHNLDYRVFTKTNEVRWISHSCDPVYAPDGKYMGRSGTNRDITERKRAEARLEQNNRKLNEILVSIRDDFYVLDRDWNFVYASRLFTQKVGKEPEDFVGKNIWKMFPKHVGTELEENFRAAMEKREIRRFEVGGKYTSAWYSMTAFPSTEGITVLGADITERKQLEEALRADEERYRAVFDNALEAIVITNPAGEGTVLSANPSACRMFGYSMEEFPGLSREAMLDTSDSNLAALLEQRERGGKAVAELIYKRKDGTRFPGEISSTIYQDKDGECHAVAIIRDITERKQAEERVQRSEAMLRAVLDQMPSGVTVRDALSGELLLANARSQEILSTLVDTPVHFADYRGFHADGLPYRNEDWPLSRSIATGEMVRAEEVNCKRNDETWITLSINSAPVRDLQGRIVMGVGVFDDITERKRAEETLRKTEAEIRSLYESMTELFVLHEVIYDASGRAIDYRILECNPAFEKITGIRRNTALGGLASKVYGTQEAPYLDIYAQVAETGEPLDFETEFSPMGKQFHISVFSPERGRFATLASDITARKRAEEALQHMTEDLRRSNAELEQFAYVASHDLQEPLRMVSSYMQLLSRRYQGKLGNDADEFIAFAVDGAKRMQSLINDLLAYSRVGTRGKPAALTACEMVLDEALMNLQIAVEESGASITHDPLPTIFCDQTQLVQVFQNLLGNSIKFRGLQAPHIHISASRQESEWFFSFRDNGIGLDPKFRERIFDIFQRLHSRASYPGTGIGLAICKRIIQRHGGRIWVESMPGEGATFYFTLPVKETT